MRSRLSLVFVCVCAFAVLVFAAGCWRVESGAAVVEVDEPDYRRGKEMVRQGKPQVALSAFERAVAKREMQSLKAPESHMELAVLYQHHMNDPISSIYHYQKYLVQSGPIAPRSAEVAEQIAAAKREFMSTLPGKPLMDASGGQESTGVINDLRLQLERYRTALAQAQAAAGLVSGALGPRSAQQQQNQQGRVVTVENPVVVSAPDSPFATAPAGGSVVAGGQQQVRQQPVVAQVQQQPASVRPQQQQQQSQQQVQAQPQAATARRHTVRQGDSLYSISRQYYGSATNAQVEAIVSANRDQLESRSASLKPGMVLRIP